MTKPIFVTDCSADIENKQFVDELRDIFEVIVVDEPVNITNTLKSKIPARIEKPLS